VSHVLNPERVLARRPAAPAGGPRVLL